MAEMTEVAKGVATHQRLVALLTQENARYRVVSHEAVGKCEAVSEIRGTALGQAQKRWSVKSKATASTRTFLLFWRPISKPTSLSLLHIWAAYALPLPARRKSIC